MAVDYLSALNVGSGLNTTELIDTLVNAERAPTEALLPRAKKNVPSTSQVWAESNKAIVISIAR